MENKNFNDILADALERYNRKTNGDAIRAMSDEELAEWIAGYALGLTGASLEMSTHAWLEWLKEEIE